MPEKKKPTRLKKRLATLNVETKKQKEALLVQLTKYPIVESACNRAGVGRSTYYDWRKNDEEFKKMADKALSFGNGLINDMAESGIIKNIQNGSNTAMIFWLKNHHPGYSDRVIHQHELADKEISKEQAREIGVALHHIGLASILRMDKKEREELENTVAERKKSYVEGWQRQTHTSNQENKNDYTEEAIEKASENIKVKIGDEKSITIKKFLDRYEADRNKRRPNVDVKKEDSPGKKRGVNLKEFFEKQRRNQDK